MMGINRATEVASEWTTNLVQETLQPLREVTLSRLRDLTWISTLRDPSVGVAALVTRMQADYAAGESIDAVAGKFKVSIAPDSLTPKELTGTVDLAALMVRSAQALSDPIWWEPALKAEHFAIACVRNEAGSAADIAELLGRRLWWFPEAVDQIVHIASAPSGAAFSAIRDTDAERELLPYLDLKDTPGQMAEAADELLGAGGGRPDIIWLAAQGKQLREFSEISSQHDLSATKRWLALEADRFATALEGLSSLEMQLLRPREAEDLLLVGAAEVGKHLRVEAPEGDGAIEGGTVAPLPDLIEGRRHVPNSLGLMLGLGAHGYQQRSGPIIHWSAVFEGDLPSESELTRFGFAVRDGHGSIEISLAIGDAPNALRIPIVYPLPSHDSAVSLALLLLTKRIRVDFFVKDQQRALRHRKQFGLVLPEHFVDEVRVRAMPAIAELMAGGLEEARVRFRNEVQPKDPTRSLAAGVVFNEHGKSEQLVDVLRPEAHLGPRHELSADDRDKVLVARHAMWQAEARRVHSPTDESQAAAADAERTFTNLIQTLRGKQESSGAREDLLEEVSALTATVATSDAAVLHLGIGPAGLDLLWVDRKDGLHLDSPNVDVDVDKLRAALEEPELGLGTLDSRAGIGECLGRVIATKAAERRIGKLTVCPSHWLHRLPVHALRTGVGDARLIDVLDIVYAPSANLVRDLSKVTPRKGGTLIAAGGLEHAAEEANLIRELVSTAEMLVGSEASPSRVLSSWAGAARVHICAHGQYYPQDFWASHLELAPFGQDAGRLSVAQLFSDGDVYGTDLAVLAACFSGAGETEDTSLDIAGGIDSSLMAAGVRNVVSALWAVDDFAAMLFNAAFYWTLAEGGELVGAYRAGVDLLRSGSWRRVRSTPLGRYMKTAGVDLDSAFEQLEKDSRSDDGDDSIDFSAIEYWAPFRLAGVGRLWRDSTR
jgi:CHAT domain-containing protein